MDEFNYYHIAVDGCEFQHCGIGVMFRRGMGYVRNSHFQGSRETDLYCYLGYPVSPSIRRSTSVGSRRFVTFAGGGWTCNADIEDCRVSAWTDPEGAIVTDNAGSILICDTVFSKPPTHHPPIKLANLVSAAPMLVTISGNESKGTEKLIDEGPNARIITLPVGKRTRLLHADDETFFPGRVDVVPGKLFDARRDFGAKGDGKTDDTLAIQATIDAARANGHQAMAYLPPGLYRVSQTLTITGGEYRVGGGGARDHCRIQWTGAPESAVISVEDPRNVKLEYVQVLGSERNGSCAIRQTGTGARSFMRYEGISVPGAYVNMTPRPRGLELVGLGKDDAVLMEGVNDGDFHIASCGRATILVSSQTASPLLVDGAEPVRDGFLGFLAYMGLNAGDPMIHVRNNQNLVIGDAYLEVTPGTQVLLEGNPGEPAGYVTIMGVERYTAGPLAEWLTKSKKVQRRDIITVANYQGRYFEGTGEFSNPPKDGYLISHTGDRPLSIIFLGNCWMTLDDYFKQGKARPAIFADGPKYNLGKGARLIRLNDTMYDLQGSDKAGDRLMVGTWPDMLPNLIPRGGLEQAATALNDLQRMGAVDLKLNYGR